MMPSQQFYNNSTTTNQNNPPINWKDALESVGGDRDFLIECLDDLVIEARISEQQIEESIKLLDYKGVKAAAHKIKGSAAYLFCKSLEDNCAQINAYSIDGIKNGTGMEAIDSTFKMYSKLLNDIENDLTDRKNKIQLDMINIHEVFIPGRLCVMGEHSDWAAQYRYENSAIAIGSTIVCSTNEGLYARCGRFRDDHFRFDSCDYDKNCRSFEGPLSANFLKHFATRGEFFSYIQGTVHVILKHKTFLMKVANNSSASSTTSNNNINSSSNGLSPTKRMNLSNINNININNTTNNNNTSTQNHTPLPGIFIDNYRTSLPIGKGLSSSAAICVLVATCFNLVYELEWSRDDIMEIAYLGEMCTPSRCGRMDQCVAMGSGSIGLMNFDNEYRSLQILSCQTPLYFIVADLHASKNTTAILQALQYAFPIPKNAIEERVHDYMREIRPLCYQAVSAIEKGDVQLLGSLMNQAQSLFDINMIPNSIQHLTSPKLHSIMNNLSIKQLTVGCKGVGSQGDGTVQLLCRNENDQKVVLELLKSLDCDGFALTIPASLPTIERPILSPFHVTSALIMIDISAYKQFAYLTAYSHPSLLPLPFKDSSSNSNNNNNTNNTNNTSGVITSTTTTIQPN